MRTATKSKAPKARRKQPATKTKQPNVQQPADLYFTMVNEMLCVENQILAALPQIVELASDEELKSSLSNHQKQTEQQRDRLKKLIGMMNRQEMPSSCPSIKALLQDGQKMAQKVQPGALRDLAVIAACTKVEYFEMSAYRSLMSMAEMNDFDSHLDLLEETFDEEKNAAQILSRQASQMDLPQMQQQKVNEQQ